MSDNIENNDDLQEINVEQTELPIPTLSFFDWLDTITSEEKGKKGFFNWLNS